MAGLIDTFENRVLDWVLVTGTPTRPSATYLALFTVAPNDAGSGGTEVSGGSYARQAVTFDAASGGATQNAATITFPTATASWGTIVGVAVMDASSGGNMILYAPLSASKAIGSGDVFEILDSDLDIQLD